MVGPELPQGDSFAPQACGARPIAPWGQSGAIDRAVAVRHIQPEIQTGFLIRSARQHARGGQRRQPGLLNNAVVAVSCNHGSESAISAPNVHQRSGSDTPIDSAFDATPPDNPA